MVSVRDEYTPKFGRQRLTLWSPPFASTFEGSAWELPGHNGFMVELDYGRGKIRVECESPRTDENWMRVDEAIEKAVDDFEERTRTRGINYTGDLLTPDHSRGCMFCHKGTVTRLPKCPKCSGEMHEWGASQGEPGMNWMCDNDTCRTRILVLSDPDNAYAECDNDACESTFETVNDFKSYTAETNVYGDWCDDGHGQRMAHGYVDPSWSLWQVDEDAPNEPHDVYDDDEEMSPVEWLAHKVTERLGAIDNWDSSGWFRQADEETNYTTGESITLNAHPVGFTPDEIEEAARLITAERSHA